MSYSLFWVVSLFSLIKFLLEVWTLKAPTSRSSSKNCVNKNWFNTNSKVTTELCVHFHYFSITFHKAAKSKISQAMFVLSFKKLLQNDHYAYLLAEILCLYCEGWGGTDSALLLGYSTVDGVGIPEVLLGKELHNQLHILLALRISQAVLRPLQSLQQLLQFWEREAETGQQYRGNTKKHRYKVMVVRKFLLL